MGSRWPTVCPLALLRILSALLENSEGKLVTPPIDTKESMHHIPLGHTDMLPQKQRHKAVANSWHVGVAGLLLWILLLQSLTTTATATTALHKSLQPSCYTTLQWSTTQWGTSPPLGPGESIVNESGKIQQITDMGAHWRAACSLPDPAEDMWTCEPHLPQTLEPQDLNRCHPQQSRGRACHEVALIAKDSSDAMTDWFSDLKPHIQKLYGHPARCIQVLTIKKLADLFKWDDRVLTDELTPGFALFGTLQQGWGRPKRSEDRYSHPIAREQLQKLNLEHIKQKLDRHKCNPH